LRDQRRVALRRGRADPLHECVAARRVERGLLPVHPLLGDEARGQVFGVERAGRVARAQVAHDGIRFPQHEAVVFEQRHQAVGVETQVVLLAHDAELPARVGALEGEAQFLHGPDHLAHVDGRQAPPQPQHGVSPVP
jgi:hypothetical protein